MGLIDPINRHLSSGMPENIDKNVPVSYWKSVILLDKWLLKPDLVSGT